ncbi:MAG TPA: hypothetical protein VGE14_15670 [Marmoricola sp.]
MRRGPTLTCVLFDPARGSAALRAATQDAAARSQLPTSVEDGAEEGLVQLHVWVGGLGLGLPEDRPEAWAEVGHALGAAVTAVDPALALAAPEWGATSLARPEYEELAPGLRSGRVRRRGVASARAERLASLADRDVVRECGEGWVWSATGAVPLWTAPRVEADRLVPAVFHAWWGRRPDEEAPKAARLRVVAQDPDPDLATALVTALPAGWSSDPTAPDAAVATPPAWADDEVSLRAALDDVTVLVEPRWALLRDPDLLWLPTAPDPAESIDGLRVRAAAGPGVLVEGPYARLERLLDVLSPGGI